MYDDKKYISIFMEAAIMKDVLICNYAKTNETDKITNAMGKGRIANYVLETMKMPESDMQEEEKQKMDEKIQAKLKAGRKLTKEEEDYLKQTNPQLYQQYKRIRAMVNAMEEKLKNATSKEEANDIIYFSISGVSKNDPYKEYAIAALQRSASEYKKTSGYNRLPQTAEDAKKKNTKKEDLFSWTPLEDIIEAQPKFEALT